MARMPLMVIDLAKIRHNARRVVSLSARQGIDVYGVVKGVLGDLRVVSAMLDGGVAGIADANLSRVMEIKKRFPATELMFIRLPMISEADDVVRFADTCLTSEKATIDALNAAAFRMGKNQLIWLIVDIGDLREGVPLEEAADLCRYAEDMPNITLHGLAVNFACYSGLIPEEMHFQALEEIRKQAEEYAGRKLHLSGGNSANLQMIWEGNHPNVDNIRVGEGILCGRESLYRLPVPGSYQDAFKLKAEVIEVKRQRTIPWGRVAQSGFGEVKRFEDRGRRKMAILAVGMEDTEPASLVPDIKGIRIEGASSDHLIIDIEDCPEDIKVGDVLTFTMGYTAVMRGMLSPYLRKVYVDEDID